MNTVINKGLAILLPEVAIVRKEIEEFITQLLLKEEYEPLYSPHIGDINLFETSGHYPYYKDSMFPPIYEGIKEHLYQEEGYLLKPMNCPFHIKAYKAVPRSYKALPLRFYEFGTVYRNEDSGALNGLLRLRGFTQDDGHIFCTEDQVTTEVENCIHLIGKVLKQFGMTVKFKLSVNDINNQEKYIGDPEQWKKTSSALQLALIGYMSEFDDEGDTPPKYEIDTGGAAFYGPKIDFIATDKLGREWQLGTIQLDFNLPERFKLVYKGSDNADHQPVMIHRALLGSVERFIAILLEHYDGRLPFWLALEQIRLIPVHNDNLTYVQKVHSNLRCYDIRSKIETDEAPLKAKIKKAKEDHISFAVIGDKEVESKTVMFENNQLSIDSFIACLSNAKKYRCSTEPFVHLKKRELL